MNLFVLALADLRQERLANLLQLLVLAFGVMLVTLLLLLSTQVGDRLQRDAAGIDLVIGAKGSPLQLILSSVYHLDIPTGNIPLGEAERWARHPMVARAIPLSLGDSLRGFRIVGSSPELLALYQASVSGGRVWRSPMEAVVGAEVAAAGLRTGMPFSGMHGLGHSGHEHADQPYRVVGELSRTGTVLDRLIVTGLDSVWAVHAPARPAADIGRAAEPQHEHEHEHEHEETAPDTPREITAMLLQYRSPIAAVTLPRLVNAQSRLQAAAPPAETARLLQLIGVGFDTLRAIAGVLLGIAALSLFVALYAAMEQRRYDLAVLRSLGASRGRIVLLLWIRAMTLASLGTALGLLLGHLAVEMLGQFVGPGRGLALTGRAWAPGEGWVLAVPLLLATAAALLPAWRVYRSDVSAILAGR